jgi:OPA family sugar phosphate sensor protein UhpC-like MFS transporter
VFARAFALTWIAYAGYYLCRKNFSVLMPYLKTEQGYTSESLAHVVFVYSIAYAAGQFLMGHLADRFGARLVVAAGALLSAASSALTGAVFPLLIAQGTNGIAQAAGWPGVLKLTRDWFPNSNLGVVMAWWSTHLVAGGLLATLFAARVSEGGWRYAAWAPSIPLALIGLLFGLLARDKPAPPGSTVAAPPGPALALTPPLLAIATMYFFVKMARYCFLFWLPLYMTETLHYSPANAGYAASIYEFMGFLGVLAAGYVSERAAGGARFPVAASMMATLAALCAIYPHASRLGPIANLAAIALIGAFTFGPDALMAGVATQEAAPPGAAARAAGFVNGVGSLGAVLAPYLVALVSVRFGWDALFSSLGVAALLGAAALATQCTAQWKRHAQA